MLQIYQKTQKITKKLFIAKYLCTSIIIHRPLFIFVFFFREIKNEKINFFLCAITFKSKLN